MIYTCYSFSHYQFLLWYNRSFWRYFVLLVSWPNLIIVCLRITWLFVCLLLAPGCRIPTEIRGEWRYTLKIARRLIVDVKYMNLVLMDNSIIKLNCESRDGNMFLMRYEHSIYRPLPMPKISVQVSITHRVSNTDFQGEKVLFTWMTVTQSSHPNSFCLYEHSNYRLLSVPEISVQT